MSVLEVALVVCWSVFALICIGSLVWLVAVADYIDRH